MLIISKVNNFDLFSCKQKGEGRKKDTKGEEEDEIGWAGLERRVVGEVRGGGGRGRRLGG